jgi:AcrR family transcriptional regulator
MMSNKKQKAPKKSDSRPYRLRERARKMEETRQRITEAAVQLHRSVGPARTTVSEIAERAGVRRMTVYNHFPSDAELIDACSSHFVQQNPPPDPAPWREIEDPAARLTLALGELYSYYRRSADMLANVLRDAAIVPALAKINAQKWWPYVDTVLDALVNKDDTAERRAALRLVIDFWTWKKLSDSGMDDTAAARLAGKMVAGL